MPRSFLLKRKEEKNIVVGAGNKSRKAHILSRYVQKEKVTSETDPPSPERFRRVREVKMIPKTLKTFRINPYDRDSCKLCELNNSEQENEQNGLDNCMDRKKAFTMEKLLSEHRHENTYHQHGAIHKKSSVSIMNVKQSQKLVERIKARGCLEDLKFRYKDGLWVDAERNRMFSTPSPYLTSPTHSYRSNETGSANSTGSGCNSYVAPPRSRSEFSSRDESKAYRICTGPCCRMYEGDEVILRVASHSYNSYDKQKHTMTEENCSCPQCHVNREFLRRGTHVPKHTASLSAEGYVHMSKRKPLSKRKALLGELEIENKRNSESANVATSLHIYNGSRDTHHNYDNSRDTHHNYDSSRDSPNNYDSSRDSHHNNQQNYHYQRQNHDKRQENFDSRQKSYKDKPDTADEEGDFKSNHVKTSSKDLLKIPAGPNRSRAVANLLERRRVAELNSSFETLRVLVPTYGNEDRTLSKIKTLKYALTYIDHLMTVLSELKSNSDFDLERDFLQLCRKDPLIQKSRDHMKNNRKLF